jgi:Tfp pilus assembly protein PilF
MKGGSQKVPLRAAAFNVKGIIAMDLNQPEVAKLQFETALKLFPDFALAQGNLAALAQNKQAATPAPKPQTGNKTCRKIKKSFAVSDKALNYVGIAII